MDGKFINKIDDKQVRSSDGDYRPLSVKNVSTIEENNSTQILITGKNHKFYFDLEGKLVKKERFNSAGRVYEQYLAHNTTTGNTHFIADLKRDSIFYPLAMVKHNRDTAGYFPISWKMEEAAMFANRYFYDYGVENEMFFINSLDYNLYKIKPSGVSLAFHLVFPAVNSIPADFNSDMKYFQDQFAYFNMNPNLFYRISNSYLIGNRLYFNWHSINDSNGLMHHMKTSETVSLKNLEPDSLSSFLPVTDAGEGVDFSNNGFYLYKDGYLYTSYSSLVMFKFKEQLGDKYDKFPPALQNYFKYAEQEANPIIIRLKPRKE